MGALDRLLAWAQRTVDGAIDRRVAEDADTAGVLQTFFRALDERDRIALKACDHASDAWTRLDVFMRRLQSGEALTLHEVVHARTCTEEALTSLAGYRRIINGHHDRLQQLRRRSNVNKAGGRTA